MSNVVVEKSFDFGVEVVKTVKRLRTENREYELMSQLIRSGTSVGANVAEAQKAQTGKDFVAKMSIASKEASEAIYWLRLLVSSDVIPKETTDPLLARAYELERLLTSIIKTKQEHMKK